ncbi:hypothetical protein AA313_de0207910 [Arthrobotrys entomopaga]|nr:hypothetical protein AA313_de0207910 [Arthrobotrys entomopaga]
MANEQPNPPLRIASVEASVPKITIQFCIQCKWNLRAAYYAQELLQTFSTSLGEVSLRPSTGGVFIITLETFNQQSILESHTIWDRKHDGGFPKTKELKVCPNISPNLKQTKRKQNLLRYLNNITLYYVINNKITLFRRKFVI